MFLYPLLLAPSIPLLDPDEGLHAAIAQEMVERGDWVVPRLQGKPFLDKPILYFWAEAASLKLFGMSEGAVRLPGLLLGLLGMAATGIVGGRIFGRDAGWLAAIFYASMILPVALTQAAAHDVALVPSVAFATLLLWEAEQAASRRAALACTMAAGVFLGLAMLTKGLVGVALVGVAYGGYLLVTRQLRPAACLRGAAAVAIAVLVASGWYIAVERRCPEYLEYYFFDRHFKGFLTATQPHGRMPWWYYLPILLGGGLPWIAYLPIVVFDEVKGRAGAMPTLAWACFSRRASCPRERGHGTQLLRPGRPLTLLACWLIGGTLLLSLAQSKLVTYVWPLLPAVAILAAVAWSRAINNTLSDGARRWLEKTFAMSCLLGPALPLAAMVVSQRHFDLQLPWTVWPIAAAASLLAWIPLWFWRFGRLRAAVAWGVLATAAQFAFLMAMVLPHFAAALSARDLADHFNEGGDLPKQIWVTEGRIGSFLFYLKPELCANLRDQQLQAIRFGDIFDPRTSLPPNRSWSSPNGRPRGTGLNSPALSGVPFEQIGCYRVYRSGALEARCASLNRWR